MRIRYTLWTEAWAEYAARLESLAARPNVKSVLEIGGGANPALSLDFVRRRGLDYTVLDISAEELAKAPDGFAKICADITALDFTRLGKYDFVFSKMVAEHVSSGRDFHKNVLRLLPVNGIACHFFSTLWALPFVTNRVLPERLAAWGLGLLQDGRDSRGRQGKFPAYYSWCRGPLAGQIARFGCLGYRVEEYVGCFGHGYYGKLKRLQRGQERLSGLLLRHPVPWFTSYAYVVLARDDDPPK
ncbi:MAG TPA: methyltransferase domain-containing protein [Candidatus Methylomirabilis sp.]